MSDNDTPRTDALMDIEPAGTKPPLPKLWGDQVDKLYELCRTLERETTALRESLAEAQRKLETMTTIAEEGYPGIAHDYEEMRIRLEAAETELRGEQAIRGALQTALNDAEASAAKAMEDAERLDWLIEKHPIDLLMMLNHHYDDMDDKSVREAIDAALRGGKDT